MKVFSATDVGKIRSINQDYIFTSQDPVGNLPNLFVVADGMGGHNAGDFASHYGVSVMVETVRKDTNFNPVKIIRNGIAAANREVLKSSREDPAMAGMGTTMVAACVVGEYLYVANVGDSRLYLIDEENIKQVSQDHSLIAEMVRLGELAPEEARNHPDKNIITRAVGTEENVEIDFFDLKLEKGQWFLMCSDGLSNMVEDNEIHRILGEASKEERDPSLALIEQANANGGKDNIAVIAVQPFSDEVNIC
ncbi:MAG: Stp1/IreP family PP2C-type Ser/Thr phosphatase [Candidatus Alectryocaccobium sp.]|jgi:serine/threonine protein phosphatase PrpC|nr:Stp1/IreP family PP2C-type Ser/Thr phosphatase [Lachnospiraceae bacterium]MDY6221708.1 Stp1/IreP family PP2C-type Ser/Thr phosphatase [Candidatus Alectryocaccobium sp.]